MSSWSVTIIGGTVASVLAGVILFYLTPAMQAPAQPTTKSATTHKCPDGYNLGYGLGPDGYLKKTPDSCIHPQNGRIIPIPSN